MANILSETQDQICLLTINRPDKLNALNKETIKELGECVKQADQDKSVKSIIITGSGDKAFVAGADISEFYQYDKEEAKALAADGQRLLFDLVENTETPVIAAVNGFALGGGLELAMSCHLRVASETAKMGLPEVSLGVIPGYGGTQRLAQLAGKGRAFELIMTAGMIGAEEAYRIGLVNHITTAEELLPKCMEIAKKCSKNSSMAIASAIRAVNAGYTSGVNGYETEINEFAKSFTTEDFKEGTAAFLEKRRANFPNK